MRKQVELLDGLWWCPTPSWSVSVLTSLSVSCEYCLGGGPILIIWMKRVNMILDTFYSAQECVVPNCSHTYVFSFQGSASSGPNSGICEGRKPGFKVSELGPCVIDFPFLTQCCQIMLQSGLCRKLLRLEQPGDNLTLLGLQLLCRGLMSSFYRSTVFFLLSETLGG